MAMVVIEKAGKKLKVSKGAYDSLYKRAGWKIKASTIKKPTEDAKSSSGVSSGDDEWAEADKELEQEQKSIDEMDFNELKKLAASKGINTKEIKTIGALKKALKEVM